MTLRAPRAAGATLLELLVCLALLSTIALIGFPSLLSGSAGLRVDLAAQELVGALRLARATAVRQGAYVGIKLYPRPGGAVEWQLHGDGDGDGVRTADIQRGVDPAIGPRRVFAHFGRDVGFGFPEGLVPRDPGDPRRRLDRLEDPVRFNRSDIASFGPLGTATPGSLYLRARNHLVVVRVFGRTGKVRILRYDARQELWR